ncbi:hypothetical protein, partial [Streptomyces albospinus]|uniref:hypothetical protein n=1 Tax=Streptomyces albospinus TaxID=285515 RepID=UPI00167118B4
MSHSQAGPGRPATLTALMAVSVLSALAAFAGAILVFAGGRGLAEQNIKDAIREDPSLLGLPSGNELPDFKAMSGPLWDAFVGDRHGTLVARAVLAIVLGLCLLVFGLCTSEGATWARVMTTVSAVAALLPHFLIWRDYEPASVTTTTLVALVTAAAAIVLAWLPPNGRYGREMKARRQGQPVPRPAGT